MAGLLPKDEARPMTAEDETVPENVEAGEEASPEEQAAYEEFVKTGFELMYKGGEAKPEIVKLLDEDPSDLMDVLEIAGQQDANPVLRLSAATTIITLQICRQTKERNGVVILHGGKAILEDLVEIAEASGFHTYSEDEMGEALRQAADLFREAAADEGLIDLDEAKEEWGELVAADQEGRLGEVAPQLAAFGQQVEASQGQEAPNG